MRTQGRGFTIDPIIKLKESIDKIKFQIKDELILIEKEYEEWQDSQSSFVKEGAVRESSSNLIYNEKKESLTKQLKGIRDYEKILWRRKFISRTTSQR
jgi:hypothetical protein